MDYNGDLDQDDSSTYEPPTIVVADDEPSLRFLCRVNLEAEGYRVLEARSGDELEQIVDDVQPVGVLIDINLGADDGVAVARRLRARHPGVAIAFFTGSVLPLPEPVERLADAVLAKPFTPEQLSETARRLARR